MSTEWTNPTSVKRQTVIQAAPEKVFSILEDLRNFEKYIPGISNASAVGDSYQITYTIKLAGIADIPFQAKLRKVDVQNPTAITFTSEGAIKANARWALQPESNGKATRLSIDVSYQLASQAFRDKAGGVGKVLGGALDSLTGLIGNALTVNDANIAQALENIKRLSET